MQSLKKIKVLGVALLGGVFITGLSVYAGSKQPVFSETGHNHKAEAKSPAGKASGLKKGKVKTRIKPATPKSPEEIIQPEALIISKKKGYLFILWDVYAHRKMFDPKKKTNRLTALRYAAYIAGAHGFQKYPEYPEARLNIIVFNERDEYGGPRWDAVEKWHTYTFRADKFKAAGISRPESIWQLDENILRSLPEKEKSKQ